jgi:RNA polymerase sigma-70 factor (ECF subfamily)
MKVDDKNDTDDQILKLLETDNTNAPKLLYTYHYKAVYTYIKDFVPDHDAAKDIIQELFTAIWIKRHSLKLIKPLRSYLFSAAHNKAINYLRDKGRQNRVMGEIVNRSGSGKVAPPADAELQTRELANQIRQALSRLPIHAKRTFLMSRKQGMTYKEIAAHFHVTEKAVEKNMSKALSLLRQYLGIYLKMLVIAWIE